MSRHLAFWKYNNGTYLDNQKVYETACVEGKAVEGLAALPVGDILNRASEIFSDYDKLDEYNFESENGSFTIVAAEQAVLFDCGWEMPETELNKIIDLMDEFDCPFYDPQIETRFDGV